MPGPSAPRTNSFVRVDRRVNIVIKMFDNHCHFSRNHFIELPFPVMETHIGRQTMSVTPQRGYCQFSLVSHPLSHTRLRDKIDPLIDTRISTTLNLRTIPNIRIFSYPASNNSIKIYDHSISLYSLSKITIRIFLQSFCQTLPIKISILIDYNIHTPSIIPNHPHRREIKTSNE